MIINQVLGEGERDFKKEGKKNLNEKARALGCIIERLLQNKKFAKNGNGEKENQDLNTESGKQSFQDKE